MSCTGYPGYVAQDLLFFLEMSGNYVGRVLSFVLCLTGTGVLLRDMRLDYMVLD